ncbi:EPIDERMAL PATTERNING FACTOR-like protein 2 [Linum grandiflorum]
MHKPFHRLHNKLRSLKYALREFNKTNYSELQLRVKKAEVHLERCRLEAFQLPTLDNMQEVKESLLEFEHLQKAEASYLRQKSCVTWVHEGDGCTKFFYNYVRSRQVRNTVRQIQAADGCMVANFDEIAGVFIAYYTSLLGTSEAVEQGNLHTMIRIRLSCSQQEDFIVPMDRREVKNALFDMHNDKSPGPDGFNAGFFKRCWSTVGDSVTEAVLHFFAGGKMPHFVNSTGNAAEEVMKMRSQIGSRPPRCEKRCSSCGHCEAIQIPISPQLTRNHDGDRSTSSLSYVSNTEYAKGDEYDSNYKPMSWKCKCGNFIFNP